MSIAHRLLLLLAVVVCTACGPTVEDIGADVRTSMQEKFNSDEEFKAYGLTVSSVIVVKQGENSYRGLAKILHQGTTHDVPVEVTADGSNVMWQVQPGGFAFLAQAELERIQRMFR